LTKNIRLLNDALLSLQLSIGIWLGLFLDGHYHNKDD